MKYEIYAPLKTTDDLSIFDFVSIGIKGDIHKRIEFSPTEIPNFVNLAFGDMSITGELDDYTISDNGDRNKILATVVFAVDIYLTRYPDKWVYIRGSTRQRTRLYRMAVGLNLEELSQKFEIYAEQAGKTLPFQKDMEINALLVKKKIT